MYVCMFCKDGEGLDELAAELDKKNFSRIGAGDGGAYHYRPGVSVRFTEQSVRFDYDTALSVDEHRASGVKIPEYVKPTMLLALEHVDPCGVCTHAGVLDIDDLRAELGLVRPSEASDDMAAHPKA